MCLGGTEGLSGHTRTQDLPLQHKIASLHEFVLFFHSIVYPVSNDLEFHGAYNMKNKFSKSCSTFHLFLEPLVFDTLAPLVDLVESPFSFLCAACFLLLLLSFSLVNLLSILPSYLNFFFFGFFLTLLLLSFFSRSTSSFCASRPVGTMTSASSFSPIPDLVNPSFVMSTVSTVTVVYFASSIYSSSLSISITSDKPFHSSSSSS